MDSPEEMDKFLEKHNFPWLKFKLRLKISQQTKAQDQMTSQVNSIKHLEES